MQLLLPLVRLLISRRLLADRWRALMLSLSVALGVSILISILYASEASIQSFERSLATLTGGYELKSRVGGISAGAISPLLRHTAREFSFCPVKVLRAQRPDDHNSSIEIIAIDAVACGDAFSGTSSKESCALVSPHFAKEKAPNPVTLTISGKRVSCIWREWSKYPATLPESGMLMDLSQLDAWGVETEQLTAIQIKPRLETSIQALSTQLLDSGLTDYYVEGDSDRELRARNLLGAFRLNLIIMAAMTLFVCGFVIFNTAQLSMHSFVNELTILRTLGLSRWQLFLLPVGDAALIGFLGSLGGVFLGRPIYTIGVSLIAQSSASLYLPEDSFSALAFIDQVPLFAGAVFLGTLTCIVGVLLPAVQTRSVQPSVGTAHDMGERSVGSLFRASIWASLAIVLTAVGFSLSLQLKSAALGYLAAFGLIAALLFLSFPVLSLTARFFRHHFIERCSVSGLITFSELPARARLVSFALAADASAISLLLGLTLMVGSFRQTLVEWTRETFQADVYVRVRDLGSEPGARVLPPQLVAQVTTLSGVASAAPLARRVWELTTEDGRAIAIVAVLQDFEHSRRSFVSIAGNVEGALRRAVENEVPQVLVSESAAHRFKLSPGQVLRSGSQSLRIGAVVKDFSTDQGALYFDIKRYKSLFGTIEPESLALMLEAGTDAGVMAGAIRSLDENQVATVTASAELRENVLSIFDRTFEITALIQYIVVAICALGFGLTFAQNIWRRRRELLIFTTLGATTRELVLSVLYEGLLVCLPALGMGVAGGLVLAAILIEAINPLTFGWSLSFHATAANFLVPCGVVFGANILSIFFLPLVLRRARKRTTLVDE